MFLRPALHRRACQAALLGALGLAASSAPAAAATYDQVDRPTGAASDSPFLPSQSQPVLTSDSGRTSYFTQASFLSYDLEKPFPDTQVRDVVNNRTAALGLGGTQKVVGFDAAEKTHLIERYEPTLSSHSYLLKPVAGGPASPIPGSELASDAALSGNGKFVVLTGETIGTRVLTIATGAVRQVGTQVLELNRYSVSDDASVIAGTYENSSASDYSRGGYYRGSTFTTVQTPAIVSPNAATVAWVKVSPSYDTYDVVARRLSTGADVVSRAKDHSSAQLQWISPDGGKVVYAGTEANANYSKSALAVDTRTGAQTPFGGSYGSYLGGDEIAGTNPPFAVISRSGRYATVTYQGSHAALVDLTDRTLPGGGDPLSASSYFRPWISRDCPQSYDLPGDPDNSGIYFQLLQPASFAPRPLVATVSVAFDGKVVKTATLTKVYVDGEAPTPKSGFGLGLPQTVKAVTFRTSVVDARGRVVTGNQTQQVRACTPVVTPTEDQ